MSDMYYIGVRIPAHIDIDWLKEEFKEHAENVLVTANAIKVDVKDENTVPVLDIIHDAGLKAVPVSEDTAICDILAL